MNDRYVSGNILLVIALWTAVAGFMGSAFVLALVNPQDWIVSAVLAAMGVTASCGAVVAHMRLYTSRLCTLVRVTSGLEDTNAEIHAIR